MPSTFTTNTGIEKIADGEQTGLWGQTTNLNFDIVDRALNGAGAISLSGTTHTLTTSNGVLSDGQFGVLVFGGSPSGTNTVTVAPNTAQKIYWVRNTTAQSVVLTQGSGGDVTVPAGTVKAVYANGAGSGAAVVDLTGVLSIGTLNLNGTAVTATAAELNILDGATVSTAELNILDGATVSTAELNILDGATLSTAELNILDGVTATTAELNILDGVTATAAQINQLSNNTFGTLTATTSITSPLLTNAGTLALSATGANVITASTNGVERARIDADGSLRVGTTTSSSSLQRIQADTGALGVAFAGRFSGAAGNSVALLSDYQNTTGEARHCLFVYNGTAVGTITSTSTTTSYNTSSDYRLKEDVQPMVGSVDRLMALKPVNFAWKTDGSRVDGFLAHEAQEVVPECVTGEKDAVDGEGNPQYQGIDQSKIVPLLVAALQEALTKIEALEARVAALETNA